MYRQLFYHRNKWVTEEMKAVIRLAQQEARQKSDMFCDFIVREPVYNSAAEKSLPDRARVSFASAASAGTAETGIPGQN